MFSLCQKQDILQVLHGSLAAITHPLQAVVRNIHRLRHGAQGNNTVLTVVDSFSKMARFIALSKLPSPKETAEVTMNQVFKIHGFSKDIVTDQGPQFVSQFWREFCRLSGATASLTLGYHLEANGQTECLKMETGLWCLVSQSPSTWSKHLVWVEYAHNSLPTSVTGFSLCLVTSLLSFQPVSWRCLCPLPTS